MSKETSPEIASIAARLAAMSDAEVQSADPRDIRRVAASALSQREDDEGEWLARVVNWDKIKEIIESANSKTSEENKE